MCFPLRKPRYSTTIGLIVGAWIITFVLFLPSFFNLYGMNGFECKTRKCTILTVAGERNLRGLIGISTIVVSFVLLLIFNLGISLRLRVID